VFIDFAAVARAQEEGTIDDTFDTATDALEGYQSDDSDDVEDI
jgi:hypothetical protein